MVLRFAQNHKNNKFSFFIRIANPCFELLCLISKKADSNYNHVHDQQPHDHDANRFSEFGMAFFKKNDDLNHR